MSKAWIKTGKTWTGRRSRLLGGAALFAGCHLFAQAQMPSGGGFPSGEQLPYLLPGDPLLPPPLEGESPSSARACLIEPWQVSEVGSPAAGIVVSLPVNRGDSVKKGQTLATMNTAVDEATLKLRQAEAAYLSRVLDRNDALFKRKLLPTGDYDEINSRARQARLQVELQQAILNERIIRSPFDGVVGERYAAPGDRVNDNKILQVAQLDPLLVKVVVPEHEYGRIAEGSSAQVSVNPAISSRPLAADVWRIDKIMDAASGTFTILLKIDNPDNLVPAGIRCSVVFDHEPEQMTRTSG